MGCCAGTENKITTNPKAFEKETIAPAVIPPAQPKPQPPKPTRKSSSDSDKKIEVIKEQQKESSSDQEEPDRKKSSSSDDKSSSKSSNKEKSAELARKSSSSSSDKEQPIELDKKSSSSSSDKEEHDKKSSSSSDKEEHDKKSSSSSDKKEHDKKSSSSSSSSSDKEEEVVEEEVVEEEVVEEEVVEEEVVEEEVVEEEVVEEETVEEEVVEEEVVEEEVVQEEAVEEEVDQFDILRQYISKLGDDSDISIEYEADHFKRPKDAGSLSAWQILEFLKANNFSEDPDMDDLIVEVLLQTDAITKLVQCLAYSEKRFRREAYANCLELILWHQNQDLRQPLLEHEYLHRIAKLLKDKKEFLRATISNILSGIYTCPNIEQNIMTMYEYENGKIIKKLIKASQHMKHAQILTQHLENIRNIYRPNEEEIMQAGKAIAIECDIVKTLKHVKKHAKHLDGSDDFNEDTIKQLVDEMLAELEVEDEDDD